jgi:hypothetical protein
MTEREQYLCYSPQQEIYLDGSKNTSTESCNSSPALLWEPSRQNYLTVVIMDLSHLVVARRHPSAVNRNRR